MNFITKTLKKNKDVSESKLKSLIKFDKYITFFLKTLQKIILSFWSEYFKFIYVSSEHCLEYPLQNAYRFLKERKLELAIELIQPFDNLKPIVILLAFNCFRYQISSLEKIIEPLWKPEKTELKVGNGHPYRKMMNKCEEIVYNLRLAHWLSEYAEQNTEKIGVKSKYTINYIKFI